MDDLPGGSSRLTAEDETSGLHLTVEPYGTIEPVIMYENAVVGFSLRYDACKYSGKNCDPGEDKGDMNITFNFSNEDVWAIKVNISLHFVLLILLQHIHLILIYYFVHHRF